MCRRMRSAAALASTQPTNSTYRQQQQQALKPARSSTRQPSTPSLWSLCATNPGRLFAQSRRQQACRCVLSHSSMQQAGWGLRSSRGGSSSTMVSISTQQARMVQKQLRDRVQRSCRTRDQCGGSRQQLRQMLSWTSSPLQAAATKPLATSAMRTCPAATSASPCCA